MNPKHNPALRIILAVTVILLAVIAALQMIPPRAVSADAPATQFSAERAMNDIKIIARQPHTAGSEAQAQVRDYIVEEVGAMGLIAEIETLGSVANILVHLPGTDNTKAVLVSGHYDSNSAAPGAGDDGVSVAAMLESLRVLSASPGLRNDIVFLFTDGEESGWTGSKAFINAHPEAKDETGMLLVFDARPGNAPLSLIETSPGDAWLVRQMTGLPLTLWAASWKNLQERNEFNTDYDIFQPAGYTGILMENEANGTRYHTPRDIVDVISPNLVQAYGQTMLALVNRFGSIDLRAQTEGSDLLYFSLSLIGLVAYPYWTMVTLSCLAILALILCVVIAWQRSEFSLKRFLFSLSGLLVGIVLIVIFAQLAWMLIESNQIAQVAVESGFEGSATWQVILMGGAAILMIMLMVFLTNRFGWIHLSVAAIMFYFIVSLIVNSMTKTDNPLTTSWIAWSFIGGVVGLGTLIFVKHPIWRIVLLSFSALLVVALAIPRIWMATFTREDAWLTVFVVCAWMSLFAPQVEAIFGEAPAGLTAGASIPGEAPVQQ
jgi:Peptidase family M28